jgi:hypothetical protein
MGDGIAGHISKGIIHQMVDACINHKTGGTYDKRAAFLQGLVAANTSQQYLALIESQAGVPANPGGPSDYLRNTWYKQIGGFWQTLQPLYPILRMGLIKAITLAGTDRDVDSYWLPLPGFPFVEVLVIQSPTQAQVVRLILTPPSEIAGSKRTMDKDMWVVSRQTSGQEVKNFETIDQVVEDVVDGIVIWRRRELGPKGK